MIGATDRGNWSLFHFCLAACLVSLVGLSRAQQESARTPPPAGILVDIGGQRLHVHTTGRGAPTVILENGTGDFSMIWALVQPRVGSFARVISYDRGGYAWSEPGTRPRTFAQIALELHTALDRLQVKPPYVLVGQSYGGLVIRGFYARYPAEVAGMVMVDAVHEDQRVVYGGQPHRIRDGAQGRLFPEPYISLDTTSLAHARSIKPSPLSKLPLDEPLNLLPKRIQQPWQWAESLPVLRIARSAELDWSPEELARMHAERLVDRATLGDLPLIVLARTNGGYPSGMSISADSLEKERKDLQADLARLSRKGKLIFAPKSGHNIHLEDPELVIKAIREVVQDARHHRE